MPELTTIKVPRPLRERIAGSAAAEGLTAASFLTCLLDRYDRERRLAAVGRSYRAATDRDYRELTEDWQAAAGDGLDGA